VPNLDLQTAEGIRIRLDVAGAGSRFAAGLIDVGMIATAALSVGLALLFLTQFDLTGVSQFVLSFFVMGSLLFCVLYFVAFHALRDGQTPGKQVMGLRLVGADGHPPSLQQHILRSILWIVDAILWVPIPLGVLVIALTPRRQRLGDLVAGTMVVHEGPRGASGEPWARETWGSSPRTYPLSAAVVRPLDASDLHFLRAVVTREGVAQPVREKLYRDVASAYLARIGLQPAGDPRVAIKELYVFLRDLRARD